jgi:Cd2+/Zn2+-exporting ATPase
VVKGRSASDESALTGEAKPVRKTPGDQVFSGTLNLWGAVEVDVARLPAESTLQKIIRLIQTAQKLKAPSERFTDKFGTGYTYAVIGGSTAMFLVWWLGFHLPPFTNTPEHTLGLLPGDDAAGRGQPVRAGAVDSLGHPRRHRLGRAARRALSAAARPSRSWPRSIVVALDKTGTLTTGELAVVGYESFPPGREREVMELAYALEANSQHPIARAIVRDAKARACAKSRVEDFESITSGQGVRGKFGDTPGAARPPRAAREAGRWPAGRKAAARARRAGRGVGGGQGPARARAAADQIRAESRGRAGPSLKRRRHQDRHADRRPQPRGRGGGAELGLDEVKAGLTPEDKVAAIQAFREQGYKVAMVGDGVNDAPSLAAADVSVAMGARGSDAALEQAEVILMHDRIENFLSALHG